MEVAVVPGIPDPAPAGVRLEVSSDDALTGLSIVPAVAGGVQR